MHELADQRKMTPQKILHARKIVQPIIFKELKIKKSPFIIHSKLHRYIKERERGQKARPVPNRVFEESSIL